MLFKKYSQRPSIRGFTLIELLIAIAVLGIIGSGIYEGFARTFEIVRLSRIKTVATALANEEIETIRNMPYSQIGLVGGSPAGLLPRQKMITKNGYDFYATTTIRNIDDAFDGQIGSTTRNDLAPADYKLIQLDIRCVDCNPDDALEFTTTVGPPGLESTSGRGSLFVRVFDANGQPVQDADIIVKNPNVSPAIDIAETTNISGILQLVDVPTSTSRYQITVSKPGFSIEKTYLPGAAENPNPVKPHASVVGGQLTQASFAIDRLASLSLQTISQTCAPRSGIALEVRGSKLIGTPSLYKFKKTYTSDAEGKINIPEIEWDSYTITSSSSSKYIAGTSPLIPFQLTPSSTLNTTITIADADPGALLVRVKDNATGLPISNASVQISLGSFTKTVQTDQGFLLQTDWSGGSGQDQFINPAQYSTSDGNINTTGTAGQLTLKSTSGTYASSGTLTSSVFDTGTTSTFSTLSWAPASQPAQTGAQPVRFQLAASNDAATTTWNYVGPNGTASTYFSSSGASIPAILSNNRYIRYKLLLSTTNTAYTPTVSDVSMTFGSSCLPPGQAYFTKLSSGTYTMTVTKPGYQTYGRQISVSGTGYTATDISLSI